jgi:hypothetical protein
MTNEDRIAWREPARWSGDVTLGQVDEDAKTRRDAPGSVYEHDMKVQSVLIPHAALFAAHQSKADEQDSSRPPLRVFDSILICLQCVRTSMLLL